MRKNLKRLLSATIPAKELDCISNSYDIIGDIAIIHVDEASRKHCSVVAQAIRQVHTHVKTVLAQVSPVYGDFRLRKLKHIGGEDRLVTVHAESGCQFAVDVKRCYFSPRLSHERMRIAREVEEGEVVVNMFAGVGCFSIIIAKHSGAGKQSLLDRC